jgi:hypothetical protein
MHLAALPEPGNDIVIGGADLGPGRHRSERALAADNVLRSPGYEQA